LTRQLRILPCSLPRLPARRPAGALLPPGSPLLAWDTHGAASFMQMDEQLVA
jgi:hypothetical protein